MPAKREGTLKGPGRRHGDDQPWAGGGAAPGWRRLQARGRGRSICVRPAPASDGVLGGETSGHILCLDKTTTGDGLVSALQVFGIKETDGQSLAELAAGMHKFPQVMINVKVAQRFDPKTKPAVVCGGCQGGETAGRRGQGRSVRASGTEP